ncbi:hypothetical protein CRI77_24720 [Mycolicibacterium duvalii]|uniref:Uncharacterized protein n=1 Tax=Mycolicibacterium duvalii TaxID=39688 RepID=A0A7I7KAN8_9MYCO|nr:hypothetical protein [Mycolicibacterium duvalii]MCV7368322.1 hypothetical protein [Mycolicibacterium duvalii]PEG35669.1 hypothetical protein CRI77_24720 [Mycolicibacterium duvalii]BBX20422.1 hypothetical protein MDUV_52820 [Mycolicibacterium duvalii]
MARDDHPSADASDADAETRILRRAPRSPSTDQTGIIRRHPTGEVPVVADERLREEHRTDERLREEHRTDDAPTSLVTPIADEPAAQGRPGPGAAIATAVAAIVSGWATAVIATDLITGWWRTDPLFCVAMGFLTAISAAANITGLIMMLLRQRTGRFLVVVGAVVALLMFTGLFIAGATLPSVVYALPLLPVVTIGLAALPQTGRWART